MNTVSNAPGRNIGAIVATIIAAALVGALALMLMDRDGAANSGISAGPQFSEPALPQHSRFPQGNEKFAPGRVIQADDLATEQAPLALCHGEGLMDPANFALLEDAVGSVATYCTGGARFAGEPDATPFYPSGDPRGEGYPRSIIDD